MQQRRQQEKNNQYAVVEGKDAQAATRVELAEVALFLERVVEDAGDEEAGEYEEEIDTVRAEDGDAFDSSGPGTGGIAPEEMRSDDAEYGEAAQAVQRRDVAGVGGRRSVGRLILPGQIWIASPAYQYPSPRRGLRARTYRSCS